MLAERNNKYMNVLITGGSRGIGLGIAKELDKAGHKLLLVGRNEEHLQQADQALTNRPILFIADVSQEVERDKLIQYISESGFSPDVLILNAAGFPPVGRSMLNASTQNLRDILEINLVSNYHLVQKLLPVIEKGAYPRIILIGSTVSIRRDKGDVYSLSKWALRSYAYSLRDEIKSLGVGVTLLNPGGTFTEQRVPREEEGNDRLLLPEDFGKIVSTILTLSPQAVVEEINLRPMLGDTY